MRPCDECGSRQVAPRRLEGVDVEECGLCGHLMGDDRAIAVVEERRAAREGGLAPEVYPLVLALERVPTFHVENATAGEEGRGDYPYVFLRLDPAGTAHVTDVIASGDLVIAVCDSAHEDLTSGAVRPRLHWSVPDPVRVGTDAAFEAAYTDLAGRIDRLAPTLAGDPS